MGFAELHVHLEGAVDAATLCEIAPDLTREDCEARMRFETFGEFLASFKFVVMHLRSADDYRLAARRLFARLAGEGVEYVEVIHSLGVNVWRGLDARGILEALREEGRQAPLQARWIVDAVRQFGEEHVSATARLAAEFAGSEVVAFGIGGDETGAPVAALRPGFAWAKQAGLHLTAHAGETSNAENVWEALSLGVERIGHGIRAVEDPQLVAELARREVPLEISLTSNVRTGAAPSYAAHPALALFRAGVPIVLNTDDPALFRTTLAREFRHAREKCGFSEEELQTIQQNAFRFAFAPPK